MKPLFDAEAEAPQQVVRLPSCRFKMPFNHSSRRRNNNLVGCHKQKLTAKNNITLNSRCRRGIAINMILNSIWPCACVMSSRRSAVLVLVTLFLEYIAQHIGQERVVAGMRKTRHLHNPTSHPRLAISKYNNYCRLPREQSSGNYSGAWIDALLSCK